MKMMRLLFLCLLVLQAAVASSEEIEGSSDDTDTDTDDEDFVANVMEEDRNTVDMSPGMVDTDKSTSLEDGGQNEFITIVIVAAVGVVVLSMVVIGVVVLVRWRMHKRQPVIYSVPTEQGQKGAV